MNGEARCLICGNPAIDHTPLRYVVRAWFWHRFHTAFERVVNRAFKHIEDTGVDW